MKAKYKKQWVNKLLDTRNYKQAIGSLIEYDGNTKRHCCLGVLRSCLPSELRRKSDGGDLTKEQLREVGLKEATQDKLITMNDDKEWNFRQIAGYISRNL